MNNPLRMLVFLCVTGIVGSLVSCENNNRTAKSSSGVNKATAKVTVGADGLTTEQRNVKQRVEEDNKEGAIKHLYVISAYSGQVIIYSTVRGKVTSGNKRLTPSKVVVGGFGESSYYKHKKYQCFRNGFLRY